MRRRARAVQRPDFWRVRSARAASSIRAHRKPAEVVARAPAAAGADAASDAGGAPDAEECARLRAWLQRDPPAIPARYFYDDHGSALFEAITRLPAYYQTRTELAILERHAAEIIERARPRHLVELGSGAGRKIRLLLDAWLGARRLRAGSQAARGPSCTMLDINAAFVQQSVERLRADYHGCAFRGVVGDFTADLYRLGPGANRLILFFAGTIGNLDPGERQAFLDMLAGMMGPGDSLLVGVDLVKDPAELEAAYNDPQGVTAAFNRNMLAVINRRFGGDFALEAFAHRAFYDAENAWIEMRLRALRSTRVTLRAPGFGAPFAFELGQGAELRTELSCKFTRASLAAAAHAVGLGLAAWFPDPAERFAVALLEPGGPAAPRGVS